LDVLEGQQIIKISENTGKFLYGCIISHIWILVNHSEYQQY